MPGRAELELLREGAVVRVIRVGSAPVHLGRALDNSVVLLDEDVSGHHAVVAPGPDGLLVTDLRSTNGTWVDGVRVAGDAALGDGAVLRLGVSCLLRVREAPEARGGGLALADLTAGTVHPLVEPRVHIGSAPGCLVELPDGPPRAATLTAEVEDELWLDLADDGRPVALGEVFEVAGRQLRVQRAPARAPVTWSHELVRARYPYVLAVALDGPGGPTARLRDPDSGRAHTITGETRATLLYVLARARAEALDAGARDDLAGWMDDEDVLVAVWGRSALRQAASAYSVLLHRIRRELDAAGFDPTFVEKRRGATRVRLYSVELG